MDIVYEVRPSSVSAMQVRNKCVGGGKKHSKNKKSTIKMYDKK